MMQDLIHTRLYVSSLHALHDMEPAIILTGCERTLFMIVDAAGRPLGR